MSCTMPIYFAGVTGLVSAAHAQGLPVLVGGGALIKDGREHACRLGADAWARDWAEAVVTIDGWRSRPPAVPHVATTLPASALDLDREAQSLASIAGQGRAARAAPQDDESRRTGLRVDDLRLVLQFLAAAQMVQADEVFLDFVTWVERVLATRGLPQGALRTELEGLAPLLPTLPIDAVALLHRAAASLSTTD